MTRRRAVRLRKAANLYRRHHNSWRSASRWRDCRARVLKVGVRVELHGDDAGETWKQSGLMSHAELLRRMAVVRRRRVLTYNAMRELVQVLWTAC
jgi:hypothetical protein